MVSLEKASAAMQEIARQVGAMQRDNLGRRDLMYIGCGNAVAADLSQARDVDSQNLANLPVLNEIIPHKDFVAECNAALSSRRSWSIPVAIVGLVVLAGSFFVGGRAGRVRA